MNETDLQLLARYSRDRAEDAFAEIVRRHLSLVFSTALRRVRSVELAEEVAQSVFMDLSRQVSKLAQDTLLSAWLYRVACRTAIDVVRRETRRQSRERIAAEMNPLNAPSEDWTQIEPLLDEAMDALDDKDRSAVLLRYFEGKSLREVGEALGSSEDAVRKRVDRALESLREFLVGRGAKVGASGLGLAIGANAIKAAPAGLAASISATSALAGAGLSISSGVAASKTITMTIFQKAVVAAVVVAAAGTAVYEARTTADLRGRDQALRQGQTSLLAEVRQLQRERNEATNQAAIALREADQLRRGYGEVLKLRGELGRATYELAQATTSRSTGANGPAGELASAWARRANSFKQWLEQHPDKRIPELQLLTEADWLLTARVNPTVATNRQQKADANTFAMIASNLRETAKDRFAALLGHAVSLYVAKHSGVLPDSLSDLLAFLPAQGDGTLPGGHSAYQSMLARYQLLRSGPIAGVPRGEPIIVEKAPADPTVDTVLKIGAGSYWYGSVGIIDMMAGEPRDWNPADIERIEPFLH
jgi:RNA polymerase sigma factor (sigma-70 family)